MINATILGTVIFYPILIHLIADFVINTNLESKRKTGGSWQITWNFLPFKKKRLGKTGSIWWVIINIVLILFYIAWIVYLQNFILNVVF
jgi:hypothetical protein